MSHLYSITKSSRQAVHQYLGRQVKNQILADQVVLQGDAIREKHPRMGCRTMYDLMGGIHFGRDQCEGILLQSGFRLKRKRNVIKTTYTQRLYRFPDLIRGLMVTAINQVWQTDITYYLSHTGAVFYIIFIVDVYSRRIVGWAANDHMHAEANITCLKMALKRRMSNGLAGLIHHSDLGSQYAEKNYLNLLKAHGIRVSMCEQAWHNAYTERINGTIKNDYLYAWEIATLSQLKKAVNRAVNAYNSEKPHRSLPQRMSPVQFEEYLLNIQKNDHPVVKIYDYEPR